MQQSFLKNSSEDSSEERSIASAPAKVILFGEHAVVYNKLALVCAINKRVYVSVETLKNNVVEIFSDHYNALEKYSLKDLDVFRKGDRYRYVRKAVSLFFEDYGIKSGIRIKIKSEVPPASGLGSSASVSVATILAMMDLFGMKVNYKRVADLAYRTELEVQGIASRTDSTIATYGGILFINGDKFERLTAELPLVVAHTGKEKSTKLMVEKVRNLRERYPNVVDRIIDAIGEITKTARDKILLKDYNLGELMNINQCLLQSLGVSNEKIDELIRVAIKSGAEGAKITGAGGGGCIIAYTRKNIDSVYQGLGRISNLVMKTNISNDGARIESGGR